MDDNDKIRRNLIIFSSSVIYASFVGVTVKEKTISLFTDSIKISVPSPSVLWVASLILVAYFFLRLIQSDEFKKDWNQAKVDFNAFKFNWILTTLEKEIATGKPTSVLDTASVPSVPPSTLNLAEIAQHILNNKNIVKKIKVDSTHHYPENKGPISIRILMTFDFPISINQSNEKKNIEMVFPSSREIYGFHYLCSPEGNLLVRTIYEYTRNVALNLSMNQLRIANIFSAWNLICKTKFGTMYCIPFLATLIATPACAARFTLTFFT